MGHDLSLNEIKRIAIIGVGLLGGSIGLALRAAGFTGTRVGIGRRAVSLAKALECEAIDETSLDPAEGVAGAGLVILCTPLSRYEPLLQTIAPALEADTYVTDVGSTKAAVVRQAEKLLPSHVRFVGSHPMAGSEKTGVEYARADLFEDALCLVTPTAHTAPETIEAITIFWQKLGGRTQLVNPGRHDQLLARVSHLPHALAAALVCLAQADDAIEVAGPGFADTTRIASGDPAMWTDILRSNRNELVRSVDALLGELTILRDKLNEDDAAWLEHWLARGKNARDGWVARRYATRSAGPAPESLPQ